MKYIFVTLGFVILIMYVVIDHQYDRVQMLNSESAVMQTSLSQQYMTINKLEDYRKSLKPPRVLPYPWPMISAEHDNLTSYWGPRMDPLRPNTGGLSKKPHYAVDMTGIKGALILAVANGIVTPEIWPEKGWHYGTWFRGHSLFNGYLVIRHDDGMLSHYGHVSHILVKRGQRVTAGQPIARISQTVDKYSTGPHLDFRLQDKDGEYVNPLLWIGLEE